MIHTETPTAPSDGSRREKAKAYFLEGYNCAQSVLLAFHEELDLDKETASRMASSFGGGMGRLREVCGAVSGMFLAAGLYCGYSDPKDTDGKKAQYQLVQALAKDFRDKNGSIVCRELLGLDHKTDAPTPSARTAEYYKKRPCAELVADAAEILEAVIQKTTIQKAGASVPTADATTVSARSCTHHPDDNKDS